METAQQKNQDEELHKLALLKVKKIKDFYTHLFVFAIGLTVYVLKTYFGMPFNFPDIRYLNIWVMGIWAFILLLDGISVFMAEVVFGKKWEQRKLKKLMESKSEKQIWK